MLRIWVLWLLRLHASGEVKTNARACQQEAPVRLKVTAEAHPRRLAAAQKTTSKAKPKGERLACEACKRSANTARFAVDDVDMSPLLTPEGEGFVSFQNLHA